MVIPLEDSRASASVALFLKVVMLPGPGASSVSEVCIKNCGSLDEEMFAKEDADREARNKPRLVN